tara:strand:- start:5905 stop:7653 length:1749 start_codon:yes stop_codon:yes gene_type:complete
MSQVNLLSVDVLQNSDIKGSNGNSSIKNQAKGGTFFDEMAQYYPKKNTTEQDGEIKRDGKPVSKTAIEQTKADNESGDDQHTLPVPVASNDETLNTKVIVNDEQYTLPVPVMALSGENKAIVEDDTGSIDKVRAKANQQEQTIESQARSEVAVSTENDDAVDLLNMLNGAQKLLAKSSEAQAEQVKTLPVQQNQSSLEKTVNNDSLPKSAEIKLNTTIETGLNELVIEQDLITEEQLAKQSRAQEAELVSDSQQNVISGKQLSDLENQPLNKEYELAAAQRVLSAELSKEEKARVVEADNARVLDEKQANVAEFNQVSDNEQTPKRNINQKTASVVAMSTTTTEAKLDTEQKVVINDAKDKSLNSVSDVELLAKAESEKQTLPAEKIASSFNQTLDAQAPKPLMSSSELAIQQEQSYESTVNTLATNAQQTQKSITAINTETIAIYRKDFANAVKDKVMVMINQKIQQVDIQLDPPEMGNIHVRVNLQNEQAAVQFIVQNQQAKEALEQNIGKLREMLAENGVDVGDANIEQRQAQEQNDNGFNGQNGNDSSCGVADGGSNENEHAVANVLKVSSTGVDYYA